MNVFKRSQIEQNQTVAVVGIGFLGALLVQLSVSAGAKVIAAARRSEQLELAAELGASDLVSLNDFWSGVTKIKELTDDRLCPVVIEATGVQAGLDFASEITGERGRLVIAGYHQDGPRTINLQSWNWRGLDVINAHERDPAVYLAGMETALELTLRGSLSAEKLITHRYSFGQINKAFEQASTRPAGFVKAVVLSEPVD